MSSPQPQSSLRSVSVVTGLSFAQLLIQFATQLVLAKYFGASGEMDAYVAALAPPTVIATILSGSLAYVLVPVFSDRMIAGGQREAKHVTAQIGIYLVILSGAAATGVAIAPRPIVELMCPGFPAEQRELTAKLLRLLAILIETNSLIAFLNALHHCHRRFALPALAGVIGTLVTLGYVWLLHVSQGIHAVAWGVVIGSAATVTILIPQFLRDTIELRPLWTPLQTGTRQALALLAPLLLGTVFWRLDPLLDRFLGSYLSEGSLSHLGYAWRFTTALMMIGTSGLSIVAFPAIAAHAAANRQAELRLELAHAVRFLLVLLVPICVGIAAFRLPVVRLLFERGKFTSADTQAVAQLLVLYLGLVAGGSLGDLLARSMYALHDTRTPVIVSTVSFLVAAALKLLFVFAADMGVQGLAAATSIYHLLAMALLATILVHRLGSDVLAGTPACLARAIFSTAVACLAAYAVGQAFTSFAVLPAAMTGAIVYPLAMWMLRDEFMIRLGQFLGRQR